MARNPAIDELHLRLAATPETGKIMRERLHGWLDEVGIDGEVGVDVVTACSEAFNNAIEHPVQPGRECVEVFANLDGPTIILIIRDFGHWHRDGASPTATTTASR